ncbi:MAG TPA: AMP-binding protein [Candidatus Obscuribacterales bacterium]
MNIAQVLDGLSISIPETAAIVDTVGKHSRVTTFRQLDKMSRRVSSALRACGIGYGDRLLMVVPMSLDTYVILLAIFRIGATAVFVDASAGLRNVRRCLELSRPKAIIAPPTVQAILRVLRIGVDIPCKLDPHTLADIEQAGHGDAIENQDDEHLEVVDSDHPALITFTSGSTHTPKGIVRTHGFLLAQHEILSKHFPTEAGDIELTTLPIFVLSNIAAGVTTVLPNADMRKPGSVNAGKVIAQMQIHRTSRLLASPAFLERIVDHCESRAIQLPEINRILTGGGPVLPGLLVRLKKIMPNASVVIAYGSTEAEPVAHIALSEISEADFELMRTGHGLLVGKPISEVSLQLIPERSPSYRRSVRSHLVDGTTPHDTAGEIVVSGPHVVTEYLDGLGDHETKIRVGGTIWHRTGDAGYLDGQGRLWLLGRMSARIEDAKGVVYPFQVEVAASENKAVSRATCVRVRGRRVLVIEEKKTSIIYRVKQLFLSPHVLTQWKEQFPWLSFDGFRIVPKIPVDRRHNSKILYNELMRVL